MLKTQPRFGKLIIDWPFPDAIPHSAKWIITLSKAASYALIFRETELRELQFRGRHFDCRARLCLEKAGAADIA